MIDLDVTVLDEKDCGLLSGSVAELGPAAARITWGNCLSLAEEHPLVTKDNRQDLLDYFAGYGAWSTEELEAWTDLELSAIVWQECASEMRHVEDLGWNGYNNGAMEGKWSGILYLSNDKIYATLTR